MAAKTKSAAQVRRTPLPPAPAAAVAASPEDLTLALERAFGMTTDDAEVVAGIVAERFDGFVEVNDETIDAEVRSLFYTLEAKRLLSFRREEYETEAGEKRRAFWWRIRRETVEELCAPEPLPRDEDIYAELPAECWQRAASN